MKAGIFLTVSIILISCIVTFFLLPKNKRGLQLPQQTTLNAAIATYTNSKFGFGFSYPKEYSLTGTTDNFYLKNSNHTINFRVDAQRANVTLLSLCEKKQLLIKCFIDSQTVITNTNGTTGTRYYLRQASPSAKLTSTVGPFYVYQLVDNAVLLFYSNRFSEDDIKIITSTLSVQKSIVFPSEEVSTTSATKSGLPTSEQVVRNEQN